MHLYNARATIFLVCQKKKNWEACNTCCEIRNFVEHSAFRGDEEAQGGFSGLWDSSIQAIPGTRAVSPVHAHRCETLRPQQFVGTVNTHSMGGIQYSAAWGRVWQYAECVGWAIRGTHHLNGCLGATRVAYTKNSRTFANFQFQN